nr:hypothetical protein [Propionibacterium sp.]
MNIAVERLVLPATWDEDSEAGRVFRAVVDLTRDIRAHYYGTPAVAYDPPELLGLLQRSATERFVGFTAAVDGRLVGRALLWLPLRENTTMIEGSWLLAPGLDAAAHAATASALLDALDTVADAEARPWHLLEVPCTPGRLVPAGGVGSADPDAPDAAALLARGFTLQQVYRYQVADLAALTDLDARLAAALVPGYRLVTWTGRVPEPHRGAFCALVATMDREVPTGGVQYEAQHWDDARLAAFEDTLERAGRTLVGTLALTDAGEPAGYTELMATGRAVAHQGDTLVAPAHRGRRLARWLKLANLAQLRAGFGAARWVTTDNAEENAAMLAINESIGFTTALHEGLWQRLPAPERSR